MKAMDQLLQEKCYGLIKKKISEYTHVEILEELKKLENADAVIFFRLLPKDLAAEVFRELSPEDKRNIVDAITDPEIMEITSNLYFDDRIDFLEEMPADIVEHILEKTDIEQRQLINQFLSYPQNSAGSLMTIEFVELRKDWTVQKALEHIKEVGLKSETIYTLYVTNHQKKLIGIVSLRQLVTTDKDEIIANIMRERFFSVSTREDQEVVASLFRDYGLIAIPVTDREGRLTGIITIDDAVEVIDRENTEDFHKMSGVLPSESEYLDTSVFEQSKNRVIWLLILMLSATVTQFIIQGYETVLSSAIILSSFIPMLTDTGGNAGSQASTMIIRGMALGEIEKRDFFTVFRKELSIGFLTSVIVAGVNFLRIYFLSSVGLQVSITVTITLMVVIIVSKLTGCVLPFLAARLHFDPAIMAGPLITTIVDAVALIIYFQIATQLLAI